MKKGKLTKKNAMRKWSKMLFLVVMLIITVTCPVYAGDVQADEGGQGGATVDEAATFGFERIDQVIAWIVAWVAKIGLVVAFFGGIQIALGFMNDDADSKVAGMKTLAAGFMVFGLCMAADNLFFVY